MSNQTFTIAVCLLMGLAMVVYAAVAPKGPKHVMLLLVFLFVVIAIAAIVGGNP